MVDSCRFESFRAGRSIGIVLLLLISGCATGPATIDSARSAFFIGDLPTARAQLDQVVASRGRYSLPAELDLAIVELADNQPAAAESRLRKLRDTFDETSGIAPVHEAASMLTDETVRRFQAAPHEQVMIRAILSICSLASDGADAESYANQAAMKQSSLNRERTERLSKIGLDSQENEPQPTQLALAPYLRGVLREATHHDFDDATRSYKLVSAIAPSFRPAAADVERVTAGVHSPPGHGVLYVFSLVGRGPVLQPVEAPITTAALSIATAVVGGQADKDDRITRLPMIASVKVPGVAVPPSSIATVAVHGLTEQSGSGTAFYGTTQSLTDVTELVAEQMDAEMPWILARSVVRRATKDVAVSSARRSLGLNGGVGTVFQFASTTAWAATEKVDTRCWGLLPREIQVLRAECPVGLQSFQLDPIGWNGRPIGPSRFASVTIHDARNTYLIIVAPDSALHLVHATAPLAKTGPTPRVATDSDVTPPKRH